MNDTKLGMKLDLTYPYSYTLVQIFISCLYFSGMPILTIFTGVTILVNYYV